MKMINKLSKPREHNKSSIYREVYNKTGLYQEIKKYKMPKSITLPLSSRNQKIRNLSEKQIIKVKAEIDYI